ncbi:hypothetical protein BKK53_09560 [Rodentibacter trehalosifermentans]|nr:hypothetical protein BKK53_09560 [Rodentibacter trehalosifermentans]
MALIKDFSYQKIGNFEIRKYPDGTMIQSCTHKFSKNQRSMLVAKLTFPLAFFNEDIKISAMVVIHEDATEQAVLSGDSDATNATCSVYKQQNTGFYLYLYDGDSHGSDVAVDIIAIGRWK